MSENLYALQNAVNQFNKQRATSGKTLQAFGEDLQQLLSLERALVKGPSDFFRLEEQRRQADAFVMEMRALEKRSKQVRQEFFKTTGIRADIKLCIDNRDFQTNDRYGKGFNFHFGSDLTRSVYLIAPELEISEFSRAIKEKRDDIPYMLNRRRTKTGIQVWHCFDLADTHRIRRFRRRILTTSALLLLSSNFYVLDGEEARFLTLTELCELMYLLKDNLETCPSWLGGGGLEADSFRRAASETFLKNEFVEFMLSFSRAWHPQSLARWELYRYLWQHQHSELDELRELMISDLGVAASIQPSCELRRYVELWTRTAPGIFESLRKASNFCMIDVYLE